MGTIHLKNIQLYAYHGCLVEESQIGSDYLVNIWVKADLSQSAISDKLEDTVDYVLLQKIVQQEMAVRSKLLEHVANRIIQSILSKVASAGHVRVKVAKKNPPIGGFAQEVSISLEASR